MSFYETSWELDKLLGLRYRATQGPEVARVCRPRRRCFIVGEEPPIPLPSSSPMQYCVYIIVKRDMPTLKAVSLLEKELRHNIRGKAVFFGLKDAEATTLQYVCLRCTGTKDPPRLLRLGQGGWARLVGYVSKCRPSPPLGNRFWIILEPLGGINALLSRIKKLGAKPLPNYYSYQRFGTRRPSTHLIGLALSRRSYTEYVEEVLNSPYPDESWENILCRIRRWRKCSSGLYEASLAAKTRSLYTYLAGLPRGIASLYASALQAYIFNLYLSMRIELGYELDKPISGERGANPPLALVPGIGYRIGVSGEARRLLKEALEEAGLGEDDIAKPMPFIGKTRPYWRRIMFRVKNPVTITLNDHILLSFSLGPGEYATNVLRELVKIPDGL